MFLFQNALKSITRNKLRNILIGIIVLVIAVSACTALSIRQAAQTAKEDTLSQMTITAQISFDRTQAMEQMAQPDMENGKPDQAPDADTSFDRGNFDFDILQGSSLTLEDYIQYAQAQADGDSYYYSGAFSLDATGDLLPYGTEEDEEESDEASEASQEFSMQPSGGMENGFPGGGERFQVNTGDFAITGYSSYDAMLSMFGEDGSYTITDGEMFDETSEELTCIISNELALYNNLSVGDTLTLCNPQCEDETYTLTISGIYTNSASSSEENNRFSMNDPANNIYMNYTALSAIADASSEADNTTTDSSGEEQSAALNITLAFTYTFTNIEHYEQFEEQVYELGLSEDYTVSSSDLATFENSLTPLETLSATALWFFLIVLIVGGIILVTLNIFNLRERKYEVGVLTAIGMKKSRVAVQFVIELFLVTFVSMMIGTAIGAAVSVPVTNTLLSGQIEKNEQSNASVSENFGFDPGQSAGERIARPDGSPAASYVNSVSSATNLTVILQLVGVGILLTIISSLAALISIMRYEPLKILSSRS
ncbi:MAG: ABC transporter permease [Lachnospiraceae bacterium]